MPLDPPPFPDDLAEAYPQIADEPVFDPSEHLALERAGGHLTLCDLGYGPEDGRDLPSNLAVAGPMRLLSPAGVAALRRVAAAYDALVPQSEGQRRTGYRKPRGLLYSSRFVRDLCRDPDLAAFLSDVAGTPLALHAMPTPAATIVYAPKQGDMVNTGWHLDSVGFACVIALNEPGELAGGRFQYFKGTRNAIAESLGIAPEDLRRSVGHMTDLPADRIESMAFPAAGFGQLMQGHMVLHRGEPLYAPGDRMVLVVAFMSLDLDYPDATNWPEVRKWNSPAVEEEYRRLLAWRGTGG